MIDNVRVSEDAIRDGTYKLTRNFNYVTKLESDLTAREFTLIDGFIKFSKSREGLTIIKENNGFTPEKITEAPSFEEVITNDENEALRALLYNENEPCTEIIFGGTSAIAHITRPLSEAFKELIPAFKPVHNYSNDEMAVQGTQGSAKKVKTHSTLALPRET